MVTTLVERKRLEEERVRLAIDQIIADLRRYALEHEGRFLVFGSVARNTISFDSDFDVIIDFPPSREPAAWSFVEEICARHRIGADIHPMSTASPRLLARIREEAIVLP